VVNVAKEEIVHRSVPVSCPLIPRNAIPPIAVKTTVGEATDFGEDIEQTLPDNIPGEKLFEQKRKEEVECDPGKFYHAVGKRDAFLLHAYRSGNGWVHVCLRDDKHDKNTTEERHTFFEDIPPVYGILSGVLQFVNESWENGPLDKFFNREVRGIVVGCGGTLALKCSGE